MALQDLKKRIHTNMNKNKKTTGLFLDIKAAFDTINQDILLYKM